MTADLPVINFSVDGKGHFAAGEKEDATDEAGASCPALHNIRQQTKEAAISEGFYTHTILRAMRYRQQQSCEVRERRA